MAKQNPVPKLYRSVIDDVINGVRDVFLDEGLDEQVLQELKQIWEGRLMASRAVDPAGGVVGAGGDNPHVLSTQLAMQQQRERLAAIQEQEQTLVHALAAAKGVPETSITSTQVSSLLTSDWRGQAGQAGGSRTTAAQLALQAASQQTGNQFMLQLQSRQPGAAAAADVKPRVLVKPQLPQFDGTSHLYDDTDTLPDGDSFTTQPAPTTAASSTSCIEQQITAGPSISSTCNRKKEAVVSRIIRQCDGPGAPPDSSDDDIDDDEEHEYRDKDDELEDDDEDKEDEDADVNVDDPLNSDDDISDEEPQALFETENVVVCQYDKVSRVRSKWKFHLKDGIMNLNGKDYVFQKAIGEAEW